MAAHSATRYPLTGKHSVVSCAGCHPPNGEATNYYPRFGSCADCHKDAHMGQFAERYEGRCESCHKVEGFTPSTFTLARHQESRFALAGAHSAVACVDCHSSTGDLLPHRYRFLDTQCVSCHMDPHNLGTEQRNCETCHSERTWATLRTFDHTATRFPLAGNHQTVNCVACHKSGSAEHGNPITFRGSPRACSACHEDVHESQFARLPGGGDCATCHSPLKWTPSNFDHATSKFPLDGAHRGVECAACHNKPALVRGRLVMVFSNTPRDCAQCH
jgi:hypothetical protein